jgi:hypothetical protein
MTTYSSHPSSVPAACSCWVWACNECESLVENFTLHHWVSPHTHTAARTDTSLYKELFTSSCTAAAFFFSEILTVLWPFYHDIFQTVAYSCLLQKAFRHVSIRRKSIRSKLFYNYSLCFLWFCVSENRWLFPVAFPHWFWRLALFLRTCRRVSLCTFYLFLVRYPCLHSTYMLYGILVFSLLSTYVWYGILVFILLKFNTVSFFPFFLPLVRYPRVHSTMCSLQ